LFDKDFLKALWTDRKGSTEEIGMIYGMTLYVCDLVSLRPDDRGVCYLTNILVAIRYGAQNLWIGIKIQNIKKELTPSPYDPHVQAP
jgi:hypothetical protein